MYTHIYLYIYIYICMCEHLQAVLPLGARHARQLAGLLHRHALAGRPRGHVQHAEPGHLRVAREEGHRLPENILCYIILH